MGAQKNRLIETVLLSTHNICLGWEIRKIIFSYARLSGRLFTELQINMDQPIDFDTFFIYSQTLNMHAQPSRLAIIQKVETIVFFF